MTTVLMVIAPDKFRDEEYSRPKSVLEERGARVVTASVQAGVCRGRFGLSATAEIALADAKPDDYDAVVFVGGGGATVFFDDPTAHEIARATYESGRILGAICIAPSTLAHAGLLSGRKVTAFASQHEDLVAHGATFTGAPLEIDDSIITANGPEAAYAFGEALAEALRLPG
jgi:protease I